MRCPAPVIVDLGDRTLIFDTFLIPRAADELRAAAEALTGRPVEWVINSHEHYDHVLGNQVFAPTADIYATDRTRVLLAEYGPADLAEVTDNPQSHLHGLETRLQEEQTERGRAFLERDLAEARAWVDALPDIDLRVPNVTFDERITLHGSQRSAELATYGGGHTESDAFLYLPQDRIAFLGDLLVVHAQPGFMTGDSEEWARILGQIEELDFDVAVPGHGPLGRKADCSLLREYICMVQRMTREVADRGGSVEEAASISLPPPFDQWDAPHAFRMNVEHLFGRIDTAH
ncbi:MAG: MBL fold metallo-hydrolase [Chloroflexota bacterium]